MVDYIAHKTTTTHNHWLAFSFISINVRGCNINKLHQDVDALVITLQYNTSPIEHDPKIKKIKKKHEQVSNYQF